MTADTATTTTKPRSPLRRIVGGFFRLWPFWVLPLLFVVYTGWTRTDAGGAAGEGFNGTTTPDATAKLRTDGRLRVGIYNIQGAIGKKVPGAWEKIAAVLGETDLCGLTEVRGNSWSVDRRSQSQMLGEELGYSWLFAPAERRFWRDSNGNGVVSRVPVGQWSRLPLPATGEPGSFRNVTVLNTTLAGKPLHVMVAHLDRGPSRPAQLQAVTQLFASLQEPVVLLADLNTDPFDKLIQPLLAIPGTQDVISQKFGAKEKRVDWILVRGLKCAEVGRVDDSSSDHAFYWAEVSN